jgi:hypothetical protein
MNTKELKTYLNLRINYLEHLLRDDRIQNVGYQKAQTMKETLEEINEYLQNKKRKKE